MREVDVTGAREPLPVDDAPTLLHVLRGGTEPPAVYGALRRVRRTRLPVTVEPRDGATPAVRYRWDEDTEILVVRLGDGSAAGRGRGVSGAVELEGNDGSWVTLELRDGVLCGLQVAVWPRMQVRPALAAPANAVAARLRVPVAAPRGSAASGAGDRAGTGAGLAEVEVDTDLAAEVDGTRRTYHLRVGGVRPVRAIRVGRDILVDVDAAGDLAGLWLLAVPPFELSS
ncbi:MAG TPA: hypothetical protein VEZ47_04140 [Gemmatirosa sp.]|nr:hypothetical protein [Gemmatirosa sp.]